MLDMDATFLSVWGLHSNLSMMWIETASKNGHVEINEQAWFTPRIIPLWPHTDECNQENQPKSIDRDPETLGPFNLSKHGFKREIGTLHASKWPIQQGFSQVNPSATLW